MQAQQLAVSLRPLHLVGARHILEEKATEHQQYVDICSGELVEGELVEIAIGLDEPVGLFRDGAGGQQFVSHSWKVRDEETS